MNEPKVSIIIPIFKVEDYIERCVRSLFNQSLDDMEFIFIDDCTPDKSIELLQSIIKDYPHRTEQIVIHRMKENSGQAKVRKWGIEHARGKYLAFCDSDDWIDENMYKKLWDIAEKENADMVVCDYVITDGQTSNIMKGANSVDPSKFLHDLMTQKYQWALWNKMYRKSSCLRNIIWPKGDMGEDMILCVQFVHNAKVIAYTQSPFYYYYKNSNSITNAIDEQCIVHRFNESIRNVSCIINLFQSNGLYESYKNIIDGIILAKKNNLRPLIRKKKYYKMWKNSYPEINYRIFINRDVSMGVKVRHFLTLLRIYNKI